LDDYKVGQNSCPTRVVTEADIVNFGCLGGDFYPLHFDEDYAKSQGFRNENPAWPRTMCLGGGFAYHSLPIEGRVVAHIGGEYKYMPGVSAGCHLCGV